MLKTCLECLCSRENNEVYGTVLNGQANTAWPGPHLQNEIMFRLPRPLNANDEIEISGRMIPNPERLFLNLMTGTSVPDYQNIACQVEASFSVQNIFLRCIENGNKYEEVLDQYPADLFPDSEFKFIIKVRVNGSQILDIDIGESYAGSLELKHSLRDITFLSLSNDITKVDELKFRFA
ncbi:uncharacterized protein LOC116766713 isoform X2 [Danaus plexippus]|uniref:uncharacterized protein LOC116766713 isoform X2 n=1 Tax=Danaus plexippus TaxID=13037 RepID=UPI0013C3EAB0|nr:uncharacterized protein LOC116766713 isoform X2 [Danaus plexippus]